MRLPLLVLLTTACSTAGNGRSDISAARSATGPSANHEDADGAATSGSTAFTSAGASASGDSGLSESASSRSLGPGEFVCAETACTVADQWCFIESRPGLYDGSCMPLPAACMSNPTCACLDANVQMTLPCSESDGALTAIEDQ